MILSYISFLESVILPGQFRILGPDAQYFQIACFLNKGMKIMIFLEHAVALICVYWELSLQP